MQIILQLNSLVNILYISVLFCTRRKPANLQVHSDKFIHTAKIINNIDIKTVFLYWPRLIYKDKLYQKWYEKTLGNGKFRSMDIMKIGVKRG